VLARGQARLSLPGVSVDLAGPAQDGDRLTLLPVIGRAIDLRLVQADPSALAAATDLSVGVGPENSGSARLIATRNAAASATRSVDVHVTDAANRLVELRDPIDGAILAAGALDQDGRATLGGLDLYLGAGALTGDWFAVRATTASSGNGEIAQAIADLRRDVTGNGAGLLDQIARLQGDLGIRAAAAQRADDTAQARLDAAKREESAIGAVDLDAEAARMVQLQQAYQASAQAMTIARSLFDTLMRMI
jgi:flagellar hook-associated protein 1 FlgK